MSKLKEIDPLVIPDPSSPKDQIVPSPWYRSVMWPILQGKVKNDPEKSAATLAAFKKACAEYLPKMTQADIAEGNNVFCVIDDMRYELENEVRDAKRAKETAQRIAREVKDPLKAKLKALEDAKDQALEDSGEEDDAKEDNKGSGTPWSEYKETWRDDWFLDNWGEEQEAEFEKDFAEQWLEEHGAPFPGHIKAAA